MMHKYKVFRKKTTCDTAVEDLQKHPEDPLGFFVLESFLSFLFLPKRYDKNTIYAAKEKSVLIHLNADFSPHNKIVLKMIVMTFTIIMAHFNFIDS